MELDFISLTIASASFLISGAVAILSHSKERPQLLIEKYELKKMNDLKIPFEVAIKNIGLHPAQNIAVKIVIGEIGRPESFARMGSSQTAGQLYTGGYKFRISGGILVNKVPTKPPNLLHLISIEYEDAYGMFGHHSKYRDVFWLVSDHEKIIGVADADQVQRHENHAHEALTNSGGSAGI